MKKQFFILLFFCFTLSSYAKSYEEYLKEAEDYENKKEWIYALGSYYDAMQNSDNNETAKKKYDDLCNCIKSGKPGYDYDEFNLKDEWKNLIRNAEKYFTERCPYFIEYEGISRRSINYDTGSVDYTLDLGVGIGNFYETITGILNSGFGKNFKSKPYWFYKEYHDKVNIDMIHYGSSDVNVLKHSIYETKYEYIKEESISDLKNECKNIYKNNGVALSCLVSRLIPTYGISVSDKDKVWVFEIPSFAMNFDFQSEFGKFGSPFVNCGFQIPVFKFGYCTCYDIKFGVFDENDVLVVEGTRQSLRLANHFDYCFNNVPKEKRAILEGGKYKVKLLGIWLNYGVYDNASLTKNDIENNTYRGIIKTLPDIQINNDRIALYAGNYWKQRKKYEEKQKQLEIEKKKAAEEKNRLLLQKKRFEEYDNGQAVLIADLFEYIKQLNISKEIIIEGNADEINFNELDAVINKGNFEEIELNFSNVKNLETIPKSAFSSNNKIRKVILPNEVLSIGEKAFSDCSKLEEIELSGSLTTIGNDCFYNCTNLKTIKLTENLKELGDYAFGKCSSIKEFIIPEGIIKLGNGLFSGCVNLTKIEIPSTVSEIGDNTFYGCKNLKKIKFNGEIKKIGISNFELCDNLTVLNLPEGIESINNYSFIGSKILEIYLPHSLKEIGDNSFENTSINIINYNGTAKEWKIIKLNKNKRLSKMTINFNGK